MTTHSTRTVQVRAQTTDPTNVVTPISNALLTVAQTFSHHRLTTPAGAERAARLLQVLLAREGWYLHHEPNVQREPYSGARIPREWLDDNGDHNEHCRCSRCSGVK